MAVSAIVSGFISTVAALIVGESFGTLGGWEPILIQAQTLLGSWILALFFGSIFALAYAFLGFSTFLPGIIPLKGALYGILIWVLLVIIGAFNSAVSLAIFSQPFLGVVLHIIWGGLLTSVYQIWPKEGTRTR
jgi:hypothetical protein